MGNDQFIFFSWCGVILDNSFAIYNTVNAILYEKGKTFLDNFDKFKEVNSHNFLDFWQQFNLDFHNDNIKEKFHELYESESSHAKTFPFVDESLSIVKQIIPTLGICTSHNAEYLARELYEFKLLKYFHEDYIFGGVENKRVTLNNFKQNHDFKNIYFVCDMIDDIAIGKEIGLITIGVSSGCHDKKMLGESKPAYIIENISDLSNLLQSI